MSQRVHADRREPAEPDQPLELEPAGDELLGTAREQASGRAARSLTPGADAALKQTLVAIIDGNELDEHVAPGAATLQVLRGGFAVTWDGGTLEVSAGEWAILPTQLHEIQARGDTVALVTTAPGS